MGAWGGFGLFLFSSFYNLRGYVLLKNQFSANTLFLVGFEGVVIPFLHTVLSIPTALPNTGIPENKQGEYFPRGCCAMFIHSKKGGRSLHFNSCSYKVLHS